jgi:predicted Fe-Mo cluster-binding NifX family protein
MRVAVANNNGTVSSHFRMCETYRLVDVEDGKIVNSQDVPLPEYQPGTLPKFVKDQGADVVIAGGMGPRAVELFDSMGVQVILGVSGDIEAVVEAFAKGELVGGDSTCTH